MNISEKPHAPVNFDFINQTLADKVEGATPMLSQYFEIKQQHPDSLLFFRMGDFYELFFDDAVEASRALDITLTRRGKHQDQDIPMCGVPFHAADVYLGRLIKQGFRVAICEQIEDPVEARKRGSKSVVKRAVARVITPGTITEESLLDGSSNNYLACIIVIHERLSIAWVDISTGDLQTQNLEPGLPVPVIITVFSDKSFTFVSKTTPASILLKKAAGVKSGSGTPNSDKVGKVSRAQLEEIAKTKDSDLTASDIDAAVKTIAGTARRMGIETDIEAKS